MKKSKSILIIMCVIAGVYLLFAGCATQPQKKPEGAPESEPTINLYLADEGETKKIDMEDYIAGVVAGEMETDWHVNALAAQAILARTFTMENIEAGREFQGADATTNHEEFQAYNSEKINDKVREAVSKTRGEVIVHQGEYTRGWFSACCGGITASAEEGLTDEKEGAGEYLNEKAKDGCLSITTPENKNWDAEIPLNEVQNAVQEIKGEGAGEVNSARIAEKGPSGRAVTLEIGDTEVSAMDFRLAVGAEEMRSTLLDEFTISNNNLVVAGKGFGHGVGMCQWGARKMAQEKKSPEEIINFYHENIDIQKLWD